MGTDFLDLKSLLVITGTDCITFCLLGCALGSSWGCRARWCIGHIHVRHAWRTLASVVVEDGLGLVDGCVDAAKYREVRRTVTKLPSSRLSVFGVSSIYQGTYC